MEFNVTKSSKKPEGRTVNYEGAEAFEPQSPELALYKVVINNLLEKKYYTSDEESLKKVVQAFGACADRNPEFVLKLAAYARQEMYLRQVPQVLLVLSGNDDRTKRFIKDYGDTIISRADEPAEVVAIQLELFGKPIPKVLKRAISSSLHQFDRYQFSKYHGKRRDVSMVDVLNLVHPKPQGEEEEEIFERIVKGELDDYPEVDPLEPPETWEVVISDKGNTEEAWREVLPKMGIFAKVRNLRNMREHGIPGENILGEEDMEHVRNSKLFPFRFYQAARALKGDAEDISFGGSFQENLLDSYTETWLSDAIDLTAENIPDELGNTFVGVDLSGSMQTSLSENSTISYREISSFFGAVLQKKGADIGAFASEFSLVRAHSKTPTLELTNLIFGQDVGGSTNGWKVIRFLRKNDVSVDRIVLLTDMQIWDSGYSGRTVRDEFLKYRHEVNGSTNLYMIDLSSYGQLLTPEGQEGVYNISGWTSKIVDFIVRAENQNEAVQEIEEYDPQ